MFVIRARVRKVGLCCGRVRGVGSSRVSSESGLERGRVGVCEQSSAEQRREGGPEW